MTRSNLCGSLDGAEPRELMRSATQAEYADGHISCSRSTSWARPSLRRGSPFTVFALGISADRERILTLANPEKPHTSTIRMIQNWKSAGE